MIWIGLFFLITFLFSSVRFKILNQEHETKIEIRFFYIFSIHLNYHKLKDRVIENTKKANFSSWVNQLKGSVRFSKLQKDFYKRLKIHCFEVSYKVSMESYSFYKLQVYLLLKESIEPFVRKKRKPKIKMVPTLDEDDVDFNIDVQIGLLSILYILFKNAKTLVQIKKGNQNERSTKLHERKYV